MGKSNHSACLPTSQSKTATVITEPLSEHEAVDLFRSLVEASIAENVVSIKALVHQLERSRAAIELAAAYIKTANISLKDYLKEHRRSARRIRWLHPVRAKSRSLPIVAACSLSVRHMARTSKPAVNLLFFVGSLADAPVHFELFLAGISWLPPSLWVALMDSETRHGEFESILEVLSRYDIVRIDRTTQTIHARQWLRDALALCPRPLLLRLIPDCAVFAIDSAAYVFGDNLDAAKRLLPHTKQAASLLLTSKRATRSRAEGLHRLGCVLFRFDDYQLAERVLTRSKELYERLRKKNASHYCSCLVLLSNVCIAMGKTKAAERLYLRALGDASYGKESYQSSFIGICISYADLLRELGHYKRAAEYLKQASEAAQGTEQDRLRVKCALAEWHYAVGEIARVDVLYDEITASPEGMQISDFTRRRGVLADYYVTERLRGKFEEAVAYLETELTYVKTSFGEESPMTRFPLHRLTRFYFDRKKYEQAETHARTALSILEKSYGLEAFQTVSALVSLAAVLSAQGKNEVAKSLVMRAVSIVETSHGRDSHHLSDLLTRLAWHYWNVDDLDEAEQLHLRAIRVWESEGGKSHSTCIEAVERLSAVYSKCGRFDEAIRVCLEEIEEVKKELGEISPRLQSLMGTLADVYTAHERYDAAECAINEALNIVEANFGPRSHRASALLSKLAKLRLYQGR